MLYGTNDINQRASLRPCLCWQAGGTFVE